MHHVPSVGRIVHYHFENARGELVTRPAVIVRTWPGTNGDLVNLQVFTDGANDGLANSTDPSDQPPRGYDNVVWRTSVKRLDDEAKLVPNEHGTALAGGTWSWPPRVG